jgi:hypothetical protein
MAEEVDPEELVSFKELVMANTIQVDAVTQLLIGKGVFNRIATSTIPPNGYIPLGMLPSLLQ